MPEATEPRTVADAPPKCDQKDCAELAVFNYTWEWGAKGVCCATHQMLLQQTSESLNRRVSFGPIAPVGPAPLTRDERSKLKGEVYALEEEVKEHKGRGLDLYRENTNLTRQVQALTVRNREQEAQLNDQRRQIEQLEEKAEARDAEHGALVDEVTRLRTLARFTEPPGSRSELGLGESRVD